MQNSDLNLDIPLISKDYWCKYFNYPGGFGSGTENKRIIGFSSIFEWRDYLLKQQNGKNTVLQGLYGEIGFGTTDLIVVRPQYKEVSVDYLYWVCALAPFRKIEESTFYGDGRQKRNSNDLVRDYTMVPLLPGGTTYYNQLS
jgi:hypothetical protein